MKYLLLLVCFFINILSAEEFSLEAYSSTIRERIKVADNLVYENIETKGQWKDSKGQYGLVFCHGNIVSENGTKKLQSFCEYKDRDNDKAWTVLTSNCLLYTSPSPRDQRGSRMPSSA